MEHDAAVPLYQNLLRGQHLHEGKVPLSRHSPVGVDASDEIVGVFRFPLLLALAVPALALLAFRVVYSFPVSTVLAVTALVALGRLFLLLARQCANRFVVLHWGLCGFLRRNLHFHLHVNARPGSIQPRIEGVSILTGPQASRSVLCFAARCERAGRPVVANERRARIGVLQHRGDLDSIVQAAQKYSRAEKDACYKAPRHGATLLLLADGCLAPPRHPPPQPVALMQPVSFWAA
mmetsp:Transcript_14136/g.31209  ORF Transcript_14136/g.31209 Transcript_14136/m.31209 type:complete len:235 (-) Transcript_14136:17-721(-)